ncbi:hypothetical protein F4678DRAFT_57683 [Xylaria arbuscula]|nr:hypothetical protein F4678DRAFT_57683 [Xylaria arbuscula]
MEPSATAVQVNDLGLTLLHPCTNAAVSQAPSTVNILFVHGLRGHPRKTWEYAAPAKNMTIPASAELDAMPTKNTHWFRKLKYKSSSPNPMAEAGLGFTDNSGPTDRNETTYWPADLLPSEVPGAKIWAYGYNADAISTLFQANNKNSILQHGQDFMVKVERALKDELPTIIVAHSLGGLVVKDAMRRMHLKPCGPYKRFLRQIRAVVFCGTPHRGSDLASWAKLSANLINLAPVDVNSRLLSDLQVDSQVLDLIQDDFMNILYQAPLRIHSFQEGKAMTGVKGLNDKVVNDFSSKLGWAPEERFESIDADHREMVKEPGVKDIMDVLKDLNRSVAPAKTAGMLKVFERLDVLPYAERKDRNPECENGTCKWFTNHPLFRNWQDSRTSSLLWVSANPGCGKSVLTKYLVDHVLQSTPTRTVCYFFFKDDFEDQRSLTTTLCCILHQLFDAKPNLLSDKILERFEVNKNTLTDSFASLWDILLTIADDKNAGEIIIIIDALDECEESERSDFAKALCKFYGNGTSTSFLKILLTSRPYVRIKRDFQILENRLPTIHLSGEDQVEVDKISKEIDIFIKHKANELSAILQLEPEEREILQNELTQVPNRTYLWVSLIFDAMSSVIGITKASLRANIRKIPKTVEAIYEKILRNSSDQDKARVLLHIVVAAERPLSLEEMSLALAIRKSHRSYADLELEPVSRFRDTVRELCGLFVIIENSKIYLLHQTAREFLVQREATYAVSDPDVNDWWRFSLRPVESHRILAEICVWHLSFEEFELYPLNENNDVRKYTDAYTFLDYSAKHWATHYRQALINDDVPEQNLMLHLIDPRSKCCMTWFKIYEDEHKYVEAPRQFTALILASNLGFVRVAEMLLEKGADIEAKDKYYRTALSYASNQGFEDTVKLLLERKADPNSLDANGHTPLHYAAKYRHEGVVKLLLEIGKADPNLPDAGGSTPLHYAAGRGHAAIVQLLHDKGASLESKHTRDGSTPLMAAAMWGRTAVVQLLLDLGADLNSTNTHGRMSLSYAALHRQETVVKLLLKQNGIDLHCKNILGQNPLLLAASRRHKTIVKPFLKQNGIDLNCKDVLGLNPLLLAAFGGHETVVKLLLKQDGIDLNCKDDLGRNPLLLAAFRGHETVVKLLLKQDGIDLSCKDDLGRNPLSLAVKNGHEAVVNMLCEKRADWKFEDANRVASTSDTSTSHTIFQATRCRY